MKKLLPFVFPLIALVIVIFLALRWYNAKTIRPEGKLTDFGEGMKIEDLSPAQTKQHTSAKDVKSVEFKAEGQTEGRGEVRYDLQDGKVYFTVSTNLPEYKDGEYQVWLKAVDSDAKRKAFVLTNEKGGYMGSAAISSETLPFEVLVTKVKKGSNDMGEVLLRAVIQKPAESK
jgi:hypothetical protein